MRQRSLVWTRYIGALRMRRAYTCQMVGSQWHASQVDLSATPIEQVVKLLDQTALLIGHLGEHAVCSAAACCVSLAAQQPDAVGLAEVCVAHEQMGCAQRSKR